MVFLVDYLHFVRSWTTAFLWWGYEFSPLPCFVPWEQFRERYELFGDKGKSVAAREFGDIFHILQITITKLKVTLSDETNQIVHDDVIDGKFINKWVEMLERLADVFPSNQINSFSTGYDFQYFTLANTRRFARQRETSCGERGKQSYVIFLLTCEVFLVFPATMQRIPGIAYY